MLIQLCNPKQRNGSAHAPAGTYQRVQILNAIRKSSSRCSGGPVK